jgi:glycosyltransferase involved in cell wall biosynthesis
MTYRVIFVAPVAELKGGAERVLMDMLRHPSLSPLLVVPGEGTLAEAARALPVPVEIVDFGQVNTIRRPFRFRSAIGAVVDALKAAWRLRQLARREKALCLYSNGLKAHGLAVLARAMGAGKVVCHIHDIPFTGSEKKFWQLLQKLATRLVAVSRPCWPENKGGEGPLPANLRLLPNGLPESLVKSETDVLPTLHQPLRLGFCGRLHPFKGVHVLIDWAEALHQRFQQQGRDFTLAIRGEAAPEQREWVEELKQRVHARGLSDRIRFEGRINGYEALYADIDMLVVPSVTPEPFGLVILEGMAMGLPVIAYPAGGILDIIREGENGFFAKDAESFCRAVEQLTTAEETYPRIQRAGLRTVREHFTLKHFYDRLEAILAELK